MLRALIAAQHFAKSAGEKWHTKWKWKWSDEEFLTPRCRAWWSSRKWHCSELSPFTSSFVLHAKSAGGARSLYRAHAEVKGKGNSSGQIERGNERVRNCVAKKLWTLESNFSCAKKKRRMHLSIIDSSGLGWGGNMTLTFNYFLSAAFCYWYSVHLTSDMHSTPTDAERRQSWTLEKVFNISFFFRCKRVTKFRCNARIVRCNFPVRATLLQCSWSSSCQRRDVLTYSLRNMA